MSRGQHPLMWMIALSVPVSAHALGLGEIHVDSRLNEPVAAEIDIVGASPEDLIGLRASVANQAAFAHLGAERPAFLASTTFKVAQDARGRPVLALRSSESFTEPLVNMVIDLRWHDGELIRQYTLLLDPAGLAAAVQSAQGRAEAVPSSLAVEAAANDAPRSFSAMTHLQVGARATLRGLARRVGARSESDLQRTMLALFRANPRAFDGNINQLHRGEWLNVPAVAVIAAIGQAEAAQQINAQMSAWHEQSRQAATFGTGGSHHEQARRPIDVAESPTAARFSTVASGSSPAAATDAAALMQRVQFLEQGLHDVQGQLEREHDKLLGMQAQVRYEESEAAAPVMRPDASAGSRRDHLESSWTALVAGVALLAGAVVGLAARASKRAAAAQRARDANVVPLAEVAPPPSAAQIWAPPPPPAESSASDVDAANEREELANAKLREEIAAAWALPEAFAEATGVLDPEQVEYSQTVEALEDTVDIDVQTAKLPEANAPGAPPSPPIDTHKLDYNLMDLDSTAQHVYMPSALNETPVFKERRRNLVDVLKSAVDREPDRLDLRMKLLETYFKTAATNRQGFLEAVQRLTRDRDYMAKSEWERIVLMGRQIAPEHGLFASPAPESDRSDEDLADCA